ncbi:MAG: hypothetical protein VX938_06530, partial [Myxococcota bacterium]|nr:hypothetical protein [Myxococcota bacterium]
ESVLVPMAMWVLAAWVHGDLWLRTRRGFHGALAVANLALALNARPEVWLVAPFLALSVVSLEGRWSALRERPRAHLVGAAALVALCAPRAWSLFHYVGDAASHGGVPGLGQGGDFAGMVNRFLTHNALWLPEIHPVSVVAMAFLAPLLLPAGRRLAATLILLSVLLWQGLSTVDLPPVSIPRVQAPALLWVSSLALLTVSAVLHGGRAWSRPLGVLLFLLMLVPSPGSVDFLWRPTNAQSFDQWWERAMESVPVTEETRCVVALAMSDPPRDIVLRHYPLYELEERSASVEVYGLETFLEAPGQVLDGHCEPLYLQGPQCSARFFGFDSEAPERADLLPLCAHIHRGFHLAPIHVEDMANQGNADFPFYGRSETLRYGIYRIDRQAMLPP